MSVCPPPGMSHVPPITAGHPRAVPASPPGGEDLGVTKPRKGWSSRVGMSPRAWGTCGTEWGDTGNEDLGGTLIHSLLLPHRGLVSHCIAILKVSPGGGTGGTCGTGVIKRPPWSHSHCPPHPSDLPHADREAGGHDHGLGRPCEVPGQPGGHHRGGQTHQPQVTGGSWGSMGVSPHCPPGLTPCPPAGWTMW